MGVCLLVCVWGQKCDFFFLVKNVHNFFGSKMSMNFLGQKCPSMSHKLSKKIFWWVRYAMGKNFHK